MAAKVRVLTWSERSEPVDVYPNGINGAIRTILEIDRGISVEAVNLLDPQQGLDESALDKTDVLVWFGHLNHADVTDENVARIVRHVVERGMGFLPLHSAHASRPLQKLFEVKAKGIGIELDGRIGSGLNSRALTHVDLGGKSRSFCPLHQAASTSLTSEKQVA